MKILYTMTSTLLLLGTIQTKNPSILKEKKSITDHVSNNVTKIKEKKFSFKKINEYEFGITYEKYKEVLNKTPGKNIFIEVPSADQTMAVGIESTVIIPNIKDPQRIKQVVIITPDTDKVEIHIPTPPSTHNPLDNQITFTVLPLSIFDPLKNLTLTTDRLSKEQQETKDILTSVALSAVSTQSKSYFTLEEKSTITLTSPTKTIQTMLKILGCKN